MNYLSPNLKTRTRKPTNIAEANQEIGDGITLLIQMLDDLSVIWEKYLIRCLNLSG